MLYHKLNGLNVASMTSAVCCFRVRSAEVPHIVAVRGVASHSRHVQLHKADSLPATFWNAVHVWKPLRRTYRELLITCIASSEPSMRC